MQEMTQKNQLAIWKEPLILWAFLALSLSLIGFVFADGIWRLVEIWNRKAEYGHSFMIPVISLFFIWQKKDQLERIPFAGSWAGLSLVLLGVVLYFIGELSTLYIIIQYSFLVTLYGLVLAWTGWRGFSKIWAPLLLLVFMIPLPDFLYQGLSAKLQLISSEIGVWVVRLFGISVYLEGNVIDLGAFKLQVVEACNGLRYLFPLMTLGFAAAYLYQEVFWKRALLFLSTIPITVLMNSFRIGAIGVTVEYWGPSMAEGFLHDFEGWVIFMACTAILVLEMWLLTMVGGKRRPLREVFGLEFPEPTPSDADVRMRKMPIPFLMSGGVLLIAFALSFSVDERTDVAPGRMAFSDFPTSIGEWRGRRGELEQIYLDVLKLDDHIIVDFDDGQNKPINFYVAYYASQAKGESAHSPRSCLPGGGWLISDLEEKTLNGVTIGDVPLNVNRVVIKKGEYTQLVYYWFQGRGRAITNEYMVKWYLFWDSLTRSRTDGALVRLTTLILPDEQVTAGDERLSAFAKAVSGTLGGYIPE